MKFKRKKNTKPHQTKKPLTYYIGNLLMIGAVVLLLFTFYPVIRLYLAPDYTAYSITKDGTFIDIPTIKAQAPIIENVDPFNEAEYKEQLTRGIAHAKGTALPGEDGMTFLFAHSSDVPWRMTRYNTLFFRLGDLGKNDSIFLYKNGERHEYKVSDKKIVWPTEVSYLTKTTDNVLILQTCTPIGTSLKRLLVFAKPV